MGRALAKPINRGPKPIILRSETMMGFGKAREGRALPQPILRGPYRIGTKPGCCCAVGCCLGCCFGCALGRAAGGRGGCVEADVCGGGGGGGVCAVGAR